MYHDQIPSRNHWACWHQPQSATKKQDSRGFLPEVFNTQGCVLSNYGCHLDLQGVSLTKIYHEATPTLYQSDRSNWRFLQHKVETLNFMAYSSHVEGALELRMASTTLVERPAFRSWSLRGQTHSFHRSGRMVLPHHQGLKTLAHNHDHAEHPQ